MSYIKVKCFFVIVILFLLRSSMAFSQGVVNGGTYKIVARHSGKILEVLNGGTTNGTNVQQAIYADSSYQQWIFTQLTNGYWRISPVHRSNAALRRSVNNCEMRSYADEASRQWSLVDVGDGYYQIVSKGYDTEFGSPGCVTIAGGSTDDGANAAVSDMVDTLRCQHFTFESINGQTPKLSVQPTLLPLGFSGVNNSSSEQTYTIVGTNLSPASGNITITAPFPFEVSTTSGSGFASTITVPYTGGTLAATTIYARFTPAAIEDYSGFITNTGGGAATKDVLVSGKGADYSTPTLIVDATSLPIGYAVVSQPSREMSYSVTGYGLTPASGNITITAPSPFKVSTTSGSGFTSSLTLPYTSGGLLGTTIYARLVPAEAKTYNGIITNAGGGASAPNVAVNGAGVNEPTDDQPIGFGQHTTGGEGGTVVTVTTYDELKEYASKEGKYIIQVQGVIENPRGGPTWLNVTSNKTVIGLGANATIKGFGLQMGLPPDDTITSPPENRIKNVIIKNLHFYDALEDNINATMFTENIWIDHCSFYSQADGAVDVIRGCDWITISWCHFVRSHKTSLIGHSDDNDHQSTGRLHATYHHNTYWYTTSRNPRGRYGLIHSFNNQIFRMGDYGIGIGHKSNHYIENTYFWRAGDAWQLMYEGGHEGILDNAGWVRETGNIYEGDCGQHPTVMPPDSLIWHPLEYYYYEAQPAEWCRDVLCVTDISDMDNPRIVSILTGAEGTAIGGTVDVDDAGSSPRAFKLEQNYPNPFNPETKISFTVPNLTSINIAIYNLNGRLVETLLDANVNEGNYSLVWNASAYSSGIYFIKLSSSLFCEIKKCTLLK